MIDLLLYPRGRGGGAPPAPLIDFDFTNAALPSGVSFSRASIGTRFNGSGVMVTETADTPRFDYDPVTLAPRGLLIEPQRTNVLPYSQDFSRWSLWGTMTRTGGQTSPMGGTEAYKIVAPTSNSTHQLYQTLASTLSGASLSLFVKPAGYNNVVVRASNKNVGFDVSDNSVYWTGYGTSREVLNSAHGFKRVVVNGIVTASTNVSVNLSNIKYYSDSDASFAGDGVSGNEIFGFQLEVGAKASSYIPTNGGVVTRMAEVVGFTIPSGVETLRYTFDDNSTQEVSVSAGPYTVPTNLARAWVKRVRSV